MDKRLDFRLNTPVGRIPMCGVACTYGQFDLVCTDGQFDLVCTDGQFDLVCIDGQFDMVGTDGPSGEIDCVEK